MFVNLIILCLVMFIAGLVFTIIFARGFFKSEGDDLVLIYIIPLWLSVASMGLGFLGLIAAIVLRIIKIL